MIKKKCAMRCGITLHQEKNIQYSNQICDSLKCQWSNIWAIPEHVNRYYSMKQTMAIESHSAEELSGQFYMPRKLHYNLK